MFNKQCELKEELKLKDVAIKGISKAKDRLKNQMEELSVVIPQMKKDVRDQTVNHLYGELANACERMYLAEYNDRCKGRTRSSTACLSMIMNVLSYLWIC